MFRVTRRRLAAISLLAAGALVTSACSSEVGAAAVVNGNRIEVSTVHEALADLEDITEGLTQTDVLGLLILEPMWRSVGSERGGGTTGQEAQIMIDSVLPDSGEDRQQFSQGSIDVRRADRICSTRLNDPEQQDAVEDIQMRIDEADVDTNPRFGEFSPEQGPTPVPPNWLVDSPPNP